MYCLNCRYTLAGLKSDRCPECGRSFDASNPHTYGPPFRCLPRLRSWRDPAVILCATILACVVPVPMFAGVGLSFLPWWVSIFPVLMVPALALIYLPQLAIWAYVLILLSRVAVTGLGELSLGRQLIWSTATASILAGITFVPMYSVIGPCAGQSANLWTLLDQMAHRR